MSRAIHSALCVALALTACKSKPKQANRSEVQPAPPAAVNDAAAVPMDAARIIDSGTARDAASPTGLAAEDAGSQAGAGPAQDAGPPQPVNVQRLVPAGPFKNVRAFCKDFRDEHTAELAEPPECEPSGPMADGPVKIARPGAPYRSIGLIYTLDDATYGSPTCVLGIEVASGFYAAKVGDCGPSPGAGHAIDDGAVEVIELAVRDVDGKEPAEVVLQLTLELEGTTSQTLMVCGLGAKATPTCYHARTGRAPLEHSFTANGELVIQGQTTALSF